MVKIKKHLKEHLFKININLFLCYLLTCSPVNGQYSKNYRMVRVGYLHSSVHLIKDPLQSPINLLGIRPLNSYYVGVLYGYRWSSIFGSRFEINYQRKGNSTVDNLGNISTIRQYHYLGITPNFGFHPINNLSIYVGPELNILVAQNTSWGNSKPFEWGIAARLCYELKRFGLSIGTMRALNYFDHTTLLPGSGVRFNLKNSNWQVGLLYKL